MEYLVLPPEVNSARMYTGAGSGPMLMAADAWGALAAGLTEAAQQLSTLVVGLTGVWLGPSADFCAAAITGLSVHTMQMASASALTSSQARVAAASFSTAFAATIPPPVIAENRARLAALIASNFLGVNTAAIMQTEAQYMEYWAQDVAAMIGYQAASGAATKLPAFTASPPPSSPVISPATIPTGGVQNALGSLLSFDPTTGWVGLANLYAQAFVSSGPYEVPLQILSLFSSMWIGQATSSSTSAADAAATAAEDAATALARAPAPVVDVAASPMGVAPSVGRLSVPPSWGGAVAKPLTVLNTTPVIPGTDSTFGMPGMFPMTRSGTPERVRYGIPIKTIIPRHPSAG